MSIKLFLIYLIFINSVLAQTEFECGMEENVYQVFPRGYVFNPPQVGGRYAPAKTLNGANMKILCIFAQFEDDNRDTLNPIWPKNSLPVWWNTFIGTGVSQAPFNPNTISNYFYEMSNGQNVIIGYVHPELIVIPGSITSDWGNKNEEVIDSIEQQVYFSHFDNWNMMQEYNQIYNQTDGYVDAVYIIWRNIGVSWGGYGALNNDLSWSYSTDEGTIITSRIPTIGMTLNIGKNGNYNFEDQLGLLAHEYGHYLFGGDHNFEVHWCPLRSGLNQRGAGLMPTGGGSLAMNPHEMYLLGYRSYSDIFYNQSDNISDYHTGGSAFRIPIPILDPLGNPNSNPDEFFIIANHQKNSIYDKNKGKGILVYHVKSKAYGRNHMDIVCADGLWDWIVYSWAPRPTGIGGPVDWEKVHPFGPLSSHLPILTKNAVNRVGGRDELQEMVYAYFSDGYYYWDRVLDNSGFFTDDFAGNQKDFFETDYNQIFTPWSNPPAYNKNRTSTNSGFQIVSKNNGIYGANFFTDSIGCLSSPPSKPQNLGIAWSNNHPKLTWETSLEPDLQSYKIWKYAEGSAMIAATVTHNPANPTHTWTDYNVDRPKKFAPGTEYIYKVKAVDNTNKESVYSDQVSINGIGDLWKSGEEEIRENVPVQEYKLFTNYPNPFNPSTTIHYSIKETGLVKVKVYDILGDEVAVLVNETKESGYHSVEFNASDLPSGVYIYTLQANGYSDSKKMLLIK